MLEVNFLKRPKDEKVQSTILVTKTKLKADTGGCGFELWAIVSLYVMAQLPFCAQLFSSLLFCSSRCISALVLSIKAIVAATKMGALLRVAECLLPVPLWSRLAS